MSLELKINKSKVFKIVVNQHWPLSFSINILEIFFKFKRVNEPIKSRL